MTELPTLTLEQGNDEPLTLYVRTATGGVPAGLATATLYASIRKRLTDELAWVATSANLSVLDPATGAVLLTVPNDVTSGVLIPGAWYRLDVVVVTSTGAVDTIYKALVTTVASVTILP